MEDKKKYRRWAVVYILLALLLAAALVLLIVARRDRGYHISDTEARMLLQAMKKKTGLGGK